MLMQKAHVFVNAGEHLKEARHLKSFFESRYHICKNECDLILERALKLLKCPHSPVSPVARWVLKCSEGDGNQIPLSGLVSLTTLKLLSHTVSVFSFQECVPIIIVQVPLLALRLLDCSIQKNTHLFTFTKQNFTRKS